MGQSASSYRKSFDSAIFGYTTSTSVYIKTNDDNEDNVLFRPFLYGLSAFPISSPSLIKDADACSNSRADSGFLLCEKDSQLWKDLIYVDRTYYNDNNNNKLKSVKQDKNSVTLSNPLTFDDILYTTTRELHLSRRGFGLISPNIGLLSMIRKLDLSFNQLTELPQEIGHLNQLECLLLSHNKIKYIPDTICHMTQLIELNISYNQIHQLTPVISHMRSLQSLHLEHNQLNELTVYIESLCNLNTLDLSYNPIKMLPAEITQLPFLRRLRLDGCPFVDSFDQQFRLAHDPPSLLETCARFIIKNEDQMIAIFQKKQKLFGKSMVETLKQSFTEPILQYLSTSKTCSFCHSPYFNSYTSRGRWIERNEMWVPLEYRLCSAHWSTEEDRMYAMFSCNTTRTKAKKSSLFKSKPEIPAIDSSKTSKTRKLQLVQRHQRRSSITNQENEIISTSSSIMTDQSENSSFPFSTIKRWKFKVRNNSSFLKKHRSPNH